MKKKTKGKSQLELFKGFFFFFFYQRKLLIECRWVILGRKEQSCLSAYNYARAKVFVVVPGNVFDLCRNFAKGQTPLSLEASL